MTIHHSKHHATYVANLNVALEKAENAAKSGDVNTLIALAPAVSITYNLFISLMGTFERIKYGSYLEG